MASGLTDLILRTDAILKRYEKYDADIENMPHHKSDDPFMDEYLRAMEEINDLTLRADEIAQEKNRALKAAMNADLRKSKIAMMEQTVPMLENLVKEGKVVTPEIVHDRVAKIREVMDGVDGIPDGVSTGVRKPQRSFGAGGLPRPGGEIMLDPSRVDGRMEGADYYTHNDETRAFQSEYEQAKRRQDLQLESIEKGVLTLKEIGVAMGEELQRHDVLIDEVNTKMDDVTKELANNNMRLKGLVTKVRSTRNFFIDIILICVLLGIGLYIYMVVS